MNAIKFEKFKTPLVITGILILAIVTAHASGSTQAGFDDVWLKSLITCRVLWVRC
jgi:conjugal transfer pilus assembly protein TraA